MTQLSKYLQLNPTKLVSDAIAEATVSLSQSESYSGVWANTDTIRYLLFTPYKPHNYPTKNLAKVGLRNIRMSEADFDEIVSKKLEPTESNSALTYRLVVSGLIQLGFLDVKKRKSKPFEAIDASKLALESLPEKSA